MSTRIHDENGTHCPNCGQSLPVEEHVILVAFVVSAPSRPAAMDMIEMRHLPDMLTIHSNEIRDNGVTGWWFAEDDRTCGSDNDSAVFVPKGRQADAVVIVPKDEE